MNDLAQKTCKPCEGGVTPMERKEAENLLSDIFGWELDENATSISKEYTWNDFQEALAFVTTVGEIAENEGHHPDIFIHGYKNVRITLSTHAIGGLSENDFILAAKIEKTLSE